METYQTYFHVAQRAVVEKTKLCIYFMYIYNKKRLQLISWKLRRTHVTEDMLRLNNCI